MSVWLDTRGKASLAVGICGRCSRKFPIVELMPDPNFPGLMVCEADKDDFDPYRLAPRAPDQITLRFVRPDVPLSGGDAEAIIPVDDVLTDDVGDGLTDDSGGTLTSG